MTMAWSTFFISLVVFGFAPGAVLRVIVLCFYKNDPRRQEMLAELRVVPRRERPVWVLEQCEVALFEGFGLQRSAGSARTYLMPGAVE